jgi:hypothetical protein
VIVRRLVEARHLDLSRSIRLRTVVLVALVVAVVASVVGFASALAITPKALTVHTAASSVPISTCTLTPAADTYADQSSGGSNFGTATTLQVKSGTNLVLLAANKRTFVRFDLASCSIPSSARVLSGRMRLFMSSAPGSTRTYQAHRVSASWAEASLDWNNQPGVAATPTATVVTGTTANVTLEWNVIADVAAFVAGSATNNGWRVADSVESNTGESQFRSREHGTASQRPSLVVTYYP